MVDGMDTIHIHKSGIVILVADIMRMLNVLVIHVCRSYSFFMVDREVVILRVINICLIPKETMLFFMISEERGKVCRIVWLKETR